MSEEKKSSANWGAILLGGCGCLVFGFGLLIVVGYFGLKAAVDAPRTVVEEFLAAAGSGDVETAHGYFSAALSEVQPLEEFRAEVERNPELFKVVDTTFSEQTRDMVKATFAGTVTLENGSELPARFVLIEEDDTWKLIEYRIGEGE